MKDKDPIYKLALENNGVISFVPKGHSMYPTLKHNGQAVIIKKKTDRLVGFDVAFYLRGDGKAVLHRVVEVLEDGYITCGDSQFIREKVLEEAVFGVLTHYYKGKKQIEIDDRERAKIARYYKRKCWRKIRAGVGVFFQRIKNRLSRRGKKV